MLSDLQIMNKWASVLTGYKSTGERIFEFARAIEAEVRKDYEALIRDAIDRVEPAPQPAAPQGDVAAWLVLADGEPHHVTPGKSDEAARLWAEEQTKCGAPYSFTFLPLCPPAAIDAAMADKGAPT